MKHTYAQIAFSSKEQRLLYRGIDAPESSVPEMPDDSENLEPLDMTKSVDLNADASQMADEMLGEIENPLTDLANRVDSSDEFNLDAATLAGVPERDLIDSVDPVNPEDLMIARSDAPLQSFDAPTNDATPEQSTDEVYTGVEVSPLSETKEKWVQSWAESIENYAKDLGYNLTATAEGQFVRIAVDDNAPNADAQRDRIFGHAEARGLNPQTAPDNSIYVQITRQDLNLGYFGPGKTAEQVQQDPPEMYQDDDDTYKIVPDEVEELPAPQPDNSSDANTYITRAPGRVRDVRPVSIEIPESESTDPVEEPVVPSDEPVERTGTDLEPEQPETTDVEDLPTPPDFDSIERAEEQETIDSVPNDRIVSRSPSATRDVQPGTIDVPDSVPENPDEFRSIVDALNSEITSTVLEAGRIQTEKPTWFGLSSKPIVENVLEKQKAEVRETRLREEVAYFEGETDEREATLHLWDEGESLKKHGITLVPVEGEQYFKAKENKNKYYSFRDGSLLEEKLNGRFTFIVKNHRYVGPEKTDDIS